MKTNPTSDLEQHRKPPSKLRLAHTSNSGLWLSLSSFLLFAGVTALSACGDDLQNPWARLRLFVWGLMTVYYLNLTIQERLELRIALLLDRLEQKGVLSAEERAVIGVVPPKTIDEPTMRGVWRALIYVGVAALFIGLLFFIATCSGTR